MPIPLHSLVVSPQCVNEDDPNQQGRPLGARFWVGWGINDPRYRVGLIILACFFGLYQKLETDQIADGGWHEVKEFMIGMGIALLIQRVRNHEAQNGRS